MRMLIDTKIEEDRKLNLSFDPFFSENNEITKAEIAVSAVTCNPNGENDFDTVNSRIMEIVNNPHNNNLTICVLFICIFR